MRAASVSFYLLARARRVLAGGSGTLRAGEVAPHIRFIKAGPETSRIELANAGQLAVIRGLVFTMSLESLLDRRRPAVHCTRRPPRRGVASHRAALEARGLTRSARDPSSERPNPP